MAFDGNIDVTVLVDQPAVPPAGFGVPLLAARGLGAGFTERIRYYTSAAEVATDLAATDLSAAVALALNTALAQDPHVASLAVGRVEADAAQQITFTFSGTTALVGENFTITINGTDYTFVATGGETPTAVAAALEPLVDADPAVSAGSGAGVLTVTADVAGDAFTYASAEDSAGLAVAEAVAQANVSISTELDAILAADSAWYGLAISTRTVLDITRAALWTETNKRLFIAQSSDADILTSVTSDIASSLQTLDYKRTAVLYHSNDAEWPAFAWMALKLAADPDETTTIWAYATLTGITPNTLTATQRTNLRGDGTPGSGKNGNVYGELGGVGATGDGMAASGLWLDLRITADWMEARIAEHMKTLQLQTSNRNSKIPFNDAGIALKASQIERVYTAGVVAGHFNDETLSMDVPTAASISAKNDRKVTIPFTCEATGAIQSATVNGNVLTSI